MRVFVAVLVLAWGSTSLQLAGQDAVASPTIHNWSAELVTDAPAAEPRFWAEMATKGTPIVEPIPGEGRHRLVTFVYRGDATTQGALVITLLNDQMANDGYYGLARMQRLAGTSIWFKTYRLPSDARLTYRIGPEVDRRTRAHLSDAEWRQKLSILGVDQLNPRQTRGTDGAESLVELPDAPRQPWILPRNDTARGTLESISVHSQILGNDRTIKVYRSPGLRPDARADNLLVVLDGDEVPETFPATIALDNLVAAGRIKSIMAIMVGNHAPTRVPEMWYSDKWAAAIEREFVATVAKRYRLPSCPERCAVAGRSLGGSGALFLAYRLPQLFGGVVAQSGGFHYSRSPADWSAAQSADTLADAGFPEGEWLTQEIAKAPHLPIRIYLETGTFEDVRYETRERPRYNAGTVLSGTRHLRDVLIAKGYALAYHEFAGTHRSVNWQGTFADGVVFALGGK